MIEQKNIVSLTITIDRVVNSSEVDLGGVRLSNGDRDFAFDISNSCSDDINGITIIEAEITFEDKEEIFSDANFELTESDLLCPNTTCSVFVGGEIDFNVTSIDLLVSVEEEQRVIKCIED